VAGVSQRSELPPEHLVAELVGLLDDGCEIDDPADLELLAGTLLLPISIPEVPDAPRADPIAAATLTALAVLAPAPLAAHAREAAVLLADRGSRTRRSRRSARCRWTRPLRASTRARR